MEVAPRRHKRLILFATLVAFCAAPSLPAQDDSVQYTVAVMLSQQSTDPDARATVATFHGLLLDELRKVPGLKLRVWTAAPPAPLGEGEYGLVIASLETAITSTGFTSYRSSVGQGAFNGAHYGNALPVEFRIDQGGQPAPRPLRGTTLMLAREGAPRPALCLQELRSRSTDGLCQTTAQFAATQAEMLRTEIFPMDAAMYQLLVARIEDRSLAERQRTGALYTLLSVTRRTAQGSALDPAVALIAVRLVAELPTARASLWRQVRGFPHPALQAPLLDSLAPGVDDYTRQEALTTLVADYAHDPEVRSALQVVADTDTSKFWRVLARYAVSGVDAWRSYVRETLKDGSLPVEEKVRPLVYSSDEAPDSFAKAVLPTLARDPEILDAVLAMGHEYRSETSIQPRGRVRRALYALTNPNSGAVAPGSRRAELQALYLEYSGPGLRAMGVPPAWTGLPQENVFEQSPRAGEPTGATTPQ